MPTMLDYKGIPVFKPINMAALPISKFASIARKTIDDDAICPTTAAIKFYAYNHLTHIIEQYQPNDLELGAYDSIVRHYTKIVTDLGVRMLTYMFCICTREARHLGGLNAEYKDLPAAKLIDKIPKKSGFDSVTTFLTLTSFGSEFSHLTIAQVLDILRIVFYQHSWSSSFGGKAWGNITDQVHKYFMGGTSLEILLDTSFTLAHNTGPIFNKGFLFKNNQGHLKEVLDVQRSGQILEYVLEGKYHATTFDKSTMKQIIEDIEQIAPIQKIESQVDWQKVMALGSIGNYKHYLPKTEHPFVEAQNKNNFSNVAHKFGVGDKGFVQFLDEKVSTEKLINIHPFLSVVDSSAEVKEKRKKQSKA